LTSQLSWSMELWNHATFYLKEISNRK